MDQYNQRIYINVSGSHYETYERTLQRFPMTLLGDTKRRVKYYHNNSQVYFFNRSRVAFDAILFYYQSNGCLIRPPSLSMEIFEYECLFYDLGDQAIRRMKEREDYDSSKKINELSLLKATNRKLDILWKFFEWPEWSMFSRVYAFISLLLVIFSIMVDCFETLPEVIESNQNAVFNEWEIVKLSLNTFFGIEYLLRLLSSPNRCKFFRSKMNIIDLLAIFPSFLIHVMNKDVAESVMFIRVLRTFRIFRLVRLSKSFETLSVVLHILSHSSQDLLTLIFCMLISCVMFGSLVYHTEMDVPDTQIQSIPEGMWFAIQTVVAVGYGDVVPTSILGKMAAATTAVIGALTMTVPLLSLGGKYFSIYTKTFKTVLISDLISTPGPGVKIKNIKDREGDVNTHTFTRK